MRSRTSKGQQKIWGDQVLENHLWMPRWRQTAHGDIHRIFRSDTVRGVILTQKLRGRVKVVWRDSGFDLERGWSSGISRLGWRGDSGRDSDF
jgi:hypothetical protein